MRKVGGAVLRPARKVGEATARLTHGFRNALPGFKPRVSVPSSALNDTNRPLPDVFRWATPEVVTALKAGGQTATRGSGAALESLGFEPAARTRTNSRASIDHLLRDPALSALTAMGAGADKALERA
ncbi:hypothetical protein [Embleya sp. NPDC001921]